MQTTGTAKGNLAGNLKHAAYREWCQPTMTCMLTVELWNKQQINQCWIFYSCEYNKVVFN